MSSPQVQIQHRLSPMRMTREQEYAQEKASLNLSDYLSKDLLTLMINLGKKLHERKQSTMSVFDLFLELERMPQFAKTLENTGIDQLEREEKLLQAKHALDYPINGTGRLYITPDVKSLLLRCVPLSSAQGRGEVTLLELWKTMLQLPEISTLVFKPNTQKPKVATEQMQPKPDSTLETTAPNVAKLSTDLTQLYKTANDRPLIDRVVEINHILRIITREEKNSVLMVGESGVGKSIIVDGLAFELSHNQQLPDFLKQYKVIKLNFSSLMASAEYPGSNVPQFMEEINKLGKLIIYLENINFSDASQEQYVLNTFLSLIFRNKSLIVIISTDPAFYISHLEREQLIQDKFEVVKIEEPDQPTILKILQKEALEISARHGVSINPAIFPQIVNLAKRYQGSIPFPQKAVSLMEEAAAASRLSGVTELTLDILKRILSEKTGIPMESISISDREKLLNLETELNNVVIGQQRAVRATVEAIKRSRAGIKDQKKPIGSFMFLGPTGVGKTELARQLAKIYYEDEKAFVRLDMSEYSEKHTSQRLIGSPPGYTGYEEGGQFTNPIIQKPYSLVLLDEVEKAHPGIFDIFLQVLDEGRLSDSRGRLADFRDSILIFTSNVGADQIFKDLTSPTSVFRQDPKAFFEQTILPELLKVFRPEFINRFDEIIPFNPLGIAELTVIARLKVKRIESNLIEKNITINIPDAELEKLVKEAYDPRFGARPIERIIRDKIETPVAQKIVTGEYSSGTIINWTYTNDRPQPNN